MSEQEFDDGALEGETVQQPAAEVDGVGEIGPYRLLQPLGQGGMGEVWLAQQSSPIRRKVALKIIRRGMDSAEIVTRFQAERQALALMSHPCVAKVYDAGTTPGGRPYFVMEYVPGVPITDYCERHQLGLHGRIELFRRVCDGVQHAHQKAILHRDLKPGNVLVTEEDGRPTPKIIDFGVAKATAQKLTENTMHTQLGVLLGTPEYMSPEQAELTGEDVDTRTDVYSLGVILYELLVGALPFSPAELRKAGFDGIRQVIREQLPARPSTRVSQITRAGEAPASLSAIPDLEGQLQGDLDWITMKALEKDRNRRYSSPLELSRDLERHLANLPVEARPPTLGYRAGRFVRRNRLPVAFAAVLALLLLGAGTGLAILYARAVESERVAEREAATARESLAFMTSLFRASDPFERGSEEITVRELLDLGAERLGELEEQPEVQAELLATIGDVYRELGDWERGHELLAEALEKRLALAGERDLEVAELQYRLGYNANLAEDYERAEEYLRASMATREERLGPGAREVADALHQIAFGRVRQGRYDEALPMQEQVMAIVDAHPGTTPASRIDYLFILGWAQGGAGQLEPAVATLEEVIELREEHQGHDTPAMGWTLNILGLILVAQGEGEAHTRAGIGYLREALELNTRLFDGDHVEVAYNKNNMARGYMELGEHDVAEPLLAEAITIASRYLDDRGGLGGMKRRHATCLRELGRHGEAAAVLRGLHASLQQWPGARDQRQRTEELLREVYEDWGRPGEFAAWQQQRP